MDKSLTIAFVIDRYFEFGGLQRDCLRLAIACAKKGHEVTVITGKWVGEKPASIQIKEVDTSAFTNAGKISKLEKELARMRFSKKFDCIVGFKKMAGLDLYFAGDPCLADKLKGQGYLKRLLPRYKKMLKNEAAVFNANVNTKILLIAQQEQEKFINNYGTSGDRFHLLPPGIDKARFSSELDNQQARKILRNEFSIGQQAFLILQVGSAFRTKGVDRSIAAVAALPKALKDSVKLVIIGAGDVAPYQAMASQLKISKNIIFAGPQKDVARFYYAADLLIHPAVTENTGTALLEAMVCGLPVLTTGNCGYAGHIINAQAGAVSPMPFHQIAFNILFESMLDKTKLEKWSDHGLHYSQTEDLYSMIDKAADLIIDFAENNSKK